MLLKRCIMIFPRFENVQVIDNIREKYDPLAKHVRPHITLVFPFESNIETSKIQNHILSVLSDIEAFEVILTGITPTKSFGNYLFLNIQKGKENIIEIHKKLYSGILEEFFPIWLKDNEFTPHMTVGRIESEQEFLQAVDETKIINDTFKTIVNEISVEIIDENEDSIIEMVISL